MYKLYIEDNFNDIGPELFGLHSNAQISTNIDLTDTLLNDLIKTQPKSTKTSSGEKQEDVLEKKALFIQELIPQKFDIEIMLLRYKISYSESMNTVLTQEATRYNILLNSMNDDLVKFINANRGKILMSE